VSARLLIPLLVLALAGPAPAWAQPRPEAPPLLTLTEVLASVQRNPKLIAADAELAEAAGLRMSADGAFDPSLNAFVGGRPLGYYDQVVGGASMSWQSPLWGMALEGGWRVGQGDFASYEGKRETLGGGELFVGLTVPLLYGGPMDAERAGRLRAQALEQGAGADRDIVLLDLRAAAEAAYWSWAAKATGRRVARELLDLALARETGLRRTIEAGAAAKIDGLEYRRSVLSRRGKLADAEAKERMAAAKLALYLRDADGRPRVVRWEEAPSLPEPSIAPRLAPEDAAQVAWAARPEGARWRAEQEVADASRRLARASALPKLDLKVGASADLPRQSDPSPSLAQPTLDARIDLAWPTAMRAGRGKVAQARSKVAQVDAKAAYARDELAARVRSLAAQLDASEQRLVWAAETVQVTEALADAERARFSAGDSDLLFVNLREQTAASAREEQAQLRADVFGLRAAWAALVRP